VQHCMPEQLALAALSEPLPDDDAAHLAVCETCRAEVATLRRGVEALAVPEFASSGAGVVPPPFVWSAIAAATGVSSAPRPEVVAAGATTPEPMTSGTAAVGEAGPQGTGSPPAGRPFPAEPRTATVTPLRRRRRRALLLVAAAVAGAAVGAGAVAVVQRPDQGTSVAATPLDPLKGHSASGRAEVVERNGQRVLEVQLTAPRLSNGYYEVWLAEKTLTGMVPLGVAQPGTITFDIPNGLDLRQYPVVDVSREPLDGNPAHSADSVARGTL
jgi:Anti-sigma-K factor rskA